MMPPSLKELNMYDAGKFTGGIPSEWGSLTNLKSLDMSNCGLHGASLWTYTRSELRSESRCAQASSCSSSSA